jgi:hypothetical protein
LSQPLEHIAMLQQCNGSQRDHVRGGFVTGAYIMTAPVMAAVSRLSRPVAT